MRTCDRNGKQFFFQQKQEKLWSFDKAKNTLIKIEILRAVKKYSLLDFTEYVSFSEFQKNSQVVNVNNIFQEQRVLVLNLLQKCSVGTSFW